MISKIPLQGPGAFQWNAGGWFGSQVGSTAWLLVGAIIFSAIEPDLATIWFVCFVIANVVGTWLWLQRGRVQPYPALQILLLTCGVAALVALLSLEFFKPANVPFAGNPSVLVALLIFPVMMLRFHLRERMSRRMSDQLTDHASFRKEIGADELDEIEKMMEREQRM